jgi:hypothetical protein
MRSNCREENASRATTYDGQRPGSRKWLQLRDGRVNGPLLTVAAKTVYDYRHGPVESARADARTETYFAEHPGPFCAFEGVWYDWEHDETITLGCLELKGDIREGSYRSAMGPRAPQISR